jgi:hypothetical protein
MAGFDLGAFFSGLFGGGDKPQPKQSSKPTPAKTSSAPAHVAPRQDPAPQPAPQRQAPVAGRIQQSPQRQAPAENPVAREVGNFFDDIGKHISKYGPFPAPITRDQMSDFSNTAQKVAQAGPFGHVDDRGDIFAPGQDQPLQTDRDKTEQNKVDRGLFSAGLGTADGTKELTWDEYDALSPKQRAAVDANTLLVNAIHADKSAGAQAASQKDSSYTSDLDSLFGSNGGSDLYAPETVKVLKQLGLGDTREGDLDNYLNQSALLTQDELGAIDNADWSAAHPTEMTRGRNATQLADKALPGVAGALAAGTPILGSQGLNSGEMTQLDQLFESLAMKQNADLFKNGGADELIGQFIQENPTLDANRIGRYFEDRLNQFDYNQAAGQKNVSLGRDKPETYTDPATFRQLYLNGGK